MRRPARALPAVRARAGAYSGGATCRACHGRRAGACADSPEQPAAAQSQPSAAKPSAAQSAAAQSAASAAKPSSTKPSSTWLAATKPSAAQPTAAAAASVQSAAAAAPSLQPAAAKPAAAEPSPAKPTAARPSPARPAAPRPVRSGTCAFQRALAAAHGCAASAGAGACRIAIARARRLAARGGARLRCRSGRLAACCGTASCSRPGPSGPALRQPAAAVLGVRQHRAAGTVPPACLWGTRRSAHLCCEQLKRMTHPLLEAACSQAEDRPGP